MYRAIIFVFAALAAQAAHATIPFTVSIESEAAGIQNSQSKFSAVGVENFNAIRVGNGQNFSTNFGNSIFTGVYSGVDIRSADQYGGAGGNGRYAVTFSSTGYSLDLASSEPGGVTYFGFWLSALDRGNMLSFYQKGKLLFEFSADVAAKFISQLPGAASYRCNPNAAFASKNCGEPYAFLNFYARGGTRFDRIVFAETPRVGGYESDNHTVGRWNRISGSIVNVAGATNGIPEPATWLSMIAGLGFVGIGLRRRGTEVVSA